jgi:AraC family transcriptional regulator
MTSTDMLPAAVLKRKAAGGRQRTRGRKGTVWLCPAGISEDFIRVEAPIQECPHIFLPGKPLEDALLKDLESDPANVAIRCESIDDDRFINLVVERNLVELQTE